MFPSAIPPVASLARLAIILTSLLPALPAIMWLCLSSPVRLAINGRGAAWTHTVNSFWFTARYREKFTDPIAMAALCMSINPAGVSS